MIGESSVWLCEGNTKPIDAEAWSYRVRFTAASPGDNHIGYPEGSNQLSDPRDRSLFYIIGWSTFAVLKGSLSMVLNSISMLIILLRAPPAAVSLRNSYLSLVVSDIPWFVCSLTSYAADLNVLLVYVFCNKSAEVSEFCALACRFFVRSRLLLWSQ